MTMGWKCCIFVKREMETFFGWRCPRTWNESASSLRWIRWDSVSFVPTGFSFMEMTEWWHKEMVPLEEEFTTYILQDKGQGHATQGRRGGKHQDLARRQEQEWRESLARAFTGLSVGRAGQGGLGLASFNSSGRLWAMGVVSSCLVPGPEMI